MVDTGQARDVTDQLVQESGLQQVSLLSYERLLSENNILGSSRVSAQQSPVDESSVSQIRILTLLSGQRQDLIK